MTHAHKHTTASFAQMTAAQGGPEAIHKTGRCYGVGRTAADIGASACIKWHLLILCIAVWPVYIKIQILLFILHSN